MAASGQAMSDGSYPIADEEDLDHAIHAVGRGDADHDGIRKHIIARAKALGLSSHIPDNWNADGSLKESKSMATDNTKQCPTCQGKGTIMDGHRDCPPPPDGCGGKGTVPVESKSAQIPGTPRSRIPMKSVENRSFALSDVQMRMDDDGHTAHFTGYASTTNEPYSVQDFMGEYDETIRSGAFAKTLREGGNCPLLFDHGGMPLASTRGGTMRLSEGKDGLIVDADLDRRQTLTNDLAIAMERGDLSQMSFSFQATKDSWSPDYSQRDVNELKLFDVSLVTYPANPNTTAMIRSEMREAMGKEGQARLFEVAGIMTQLREGKTISAANADLLQQALDALNKADDTLSTDVATALGQIDSALDDGQKAISAVLDVTDPDGGPKDPDAYGDQKKNTNSVKGSAEGVDNGGASSAAAASQSNPGDGAGVRAKHTPASVLETRAMLAELDAI